VVRNLILFCCKYKIYQTPRTRLGCGREHLLPSLAAPRRSQSCKPREMTKSKGSCAHVPLCIILYSRDGRSRKLRKRRRIEHFRASQGQALTVLVHIHDRLERYGDVCLMQEYDAVSKPGNALANCYSGQDCTVNGGTCLFLVAFRVISDQRLVHRSSVIGHRRPNENIAIYAEDKVHPKILQLMIVELRALHQTAGNFR